MQNDEDDGIAVLVIPARPNPPLPSNITQRPTTVVNPNIAVRPPAPPIPPQCRPAHQAAMERVAALERLGVMAAKNNDRPASMRFFNEMRQLRATLPPC